MRVLYIGGTGEISYACVCRSRAVGQEVTVFNRGTSVEALPEGVAHIKGDIADAALYASLARDNFDVVCQFLTFTPAEMQRDIDTFAGHCGQFVFVSSASCYQKPLTVTIITEAVPLANPFSDYSRKKIECETVLGRATASGTIVATVVRPSHTFRKRFPGGLTTSVDWAWRIVNDRPVILQGDGNTLWTYTHASDFAVPFVNLLGHARAYNDHFHITRHLEAFTWNDIFTEVGHALGRDVRIVHVPTETLLRYNPAWRDGLWGDKSWSKVFDNSKVMDVAGPFRCEVGLADGMARVAGCVQPQLARFTPDAEQHALLDRIAREQSGLGAQCSGNSR